jgi:lysozyme
MIASAGADQNLVLYFTQFEREPLVLTPGSISGLNTVDFSPNSDQVVAGGCLSTDRTGACGAGLLTFWELTSGDYNTTSMEIHRGEITAVQFDPSGQRIATGGGDGVVYIWNVPPTNSGRWSANSVSAFTGQGGPIRSLVFSPNGRYLISTTNSNILIVRNLQTGEVPPFPLQKSLINALAFSPDNRFLAAGGEDGNIYIFDMSRFVSVGEPLSQHTFAVTDLDFSPDSLSLVSSSEDGTLIYWDLSELGRIGRLATAPNRQVLQGHNDVVLSVAFGPDGVSLASSGRDSAIIEWHLQAPYPLATNFIQSTDVVTGLGFADGLIVNRNNGVITSWDLDSGLSSAGAQWVQNDDPIRYPASVSHIFIQPEGQVIGLQNNRIQVVEVLGVDVSQNEGEVNWSEVKGAGYQFAFCAATEGATIVDPLFERNWVGIGEAGLIRGAYHTFAPADNPLDQAAFFAKSVPWEEGDLPPVVVVTDLQELGVTEFLSRLQEFLVELENLTGRKPMIYTSPIFWQSLTEIKSTAQTGLIPVTGGGSNFTPSGYQLWVANYTSASQPSLPTGWGTWTFWQYTDQGNAVDEQGNFIQATRVPGIQGNVYLNRFNGSLQALQSLARGEPPIAADPDVESTVLVNLETNERLGAVLPLLNPTSAALHPNGSLLAIGSENGAITFWDLEQGSLTGRVLTYSTISVQSLAFSPEGRYLAAGFTDGNIAIWDLETEGANPTVLVGHATRVISLAYGGSGNVLASGSAAGAVILWDLETNNPVGQQFSGPNASASALAIDADENLLAAGFEDGTVLIWDIDIDSWKIKACQRAGRNMTEAEWTKYMAEMDYQTTCP